MQKSQRHCIGPLNFDKGSFPGSFSQLGRSMISFSNICLPHQPFSLLDFPLKYCDQTSSPTVRDAVKPPDSLNQKYGSGGVSMGPRRRPSCDGGRLLTTYSITSVLSKQPQSLPADMALSMMTPCFSSLSPADQALDYSTRDLDT